MVSIQIVGGLTRDAELKYSAGGEAILHFSVGTSDRVKKDGNWVEESSYWDCTMFGKRTESIAQYLVKGKQVAINGSAKIDSWEKDGQKHSKCKVTVNDVQLLGSGGNKDAPAKAPAKPAKQNDLPDSFDDGRLPF